MTDDEGNTEFSDGGCGWITFDFGMWYVSGKPSDSLYDLLRWYYVKIIGNIHDNPELLEGGGGAP